MKITAINECHCTTVKGKNVVLTPGQTDDIDDKQAANLIRLRAARATEELQAEAAKRSSRKAAGSSKKQTTKRTTRNKTQERASDDTGDGAGAGAKRTDLID